MGTAMVSVFTDHNRIVRKAAFTLLELMVVIGIISIVLIALVPAVSSLGKSSGRKAAIGSLLGALEQARANAIKTTRPSYLVFPAFSSGSPNTLDRYHYKAFAIFEDNPENASAPKQLTNWKSLPTGIAFRAKAGSPGCVTDLPVASALTPPATFTFTPEEGATASFYCVKFNERGEVESIIPPTTNVKIGVFEGRVDGVTEVITSKKDAAGEPATQESIKIARLTGRAERAQ